MTESQKEPYKLIAAQVHRCLEAGVSHLDIAKLTGRTGSVQPETPKP